MSDESENYLGFNEKMRQNVFSDFSKWTKILQIRVNDNYLDLGLFDQCMLAVRIIFMLIYFRLSANQFLT